MTESIHPSTTDRISAGRLFGEGPQLLAFTSIHIMLLFPRLSPCCSEIVIAEGVREEEKVKIILCPICIFPFPNCHVIEEGTRSVATAHNSQELHWGEMQDNSVDIPERCCF